MDNVVKFKTRAELENEKKEKVLADFEEFAKKEQRKMILAENEDGTHREVIYKEGTGFSNEEVEWLANWLKQGFNKNDE